MRWRRRRQLHRRACHRRHHLPPGTLPARAIRRPVRAAWRPPERPALTLRLSSTASQPLPLARLSQPSMSSGAFLDQCSVARGEQASETNPRQMLASDDLRERASISRRHLLRPGGARVRGGGSSALGAPQRACGACIRRRPLEWRGSRGAGARPTAAVARVASNARAPASSSRWLAGVGWRG